jgi:hypothetical protein
VENLICLCASCHQRADTEAWGEKALRQYKERPSVLRRLAPPVLNASSGPIVQRLVEFQAEFFRHAPPSETDAGLRQGDPDVEVSEIARRWCAAVANKHDSAVVVYRQYRDTLPESSSRDLDRAAQKIQVGRRKWLNLMTKPDVLAVGSDLRTAALEFHFHRIVCDAIEIEIRKERGRPPSVKAINHIMDLSEIGRDDEV